MGGHTSEHEVQLFTANVVKVYVDKALRSFDELFLERRLLVVDADVSTKGLDPLALLVAAGNANDSLASDQLLGDLDCHGTRSTSSTRDDHTIRGLGTDDFGQTEVSRQARKAQSTQI